MFKYFLSWRHFGVNLILWLIFDRFQSQNKNFKRYIPFLAINEETFWFYEQKPSKKVNSCAEERLLKYRVFADSFEFLKIFLERFCFNTLFQKKYFPQAFLLWETFFWKNIKKISPPHNLQKPLFWTKIFVFLQKHHLKPDEKNLSFLTFLLNLFWNNYYAGKI